MTLARVIPGSSAASRWTCVGWIIPVMCISATAGAQDALPADAPPDYVPLGAYLSWERPPACAAYFKIDPWEDVCRRLDALAKNSVDTLWVTNMSEADLPRLIQECEKRTIKLIPSMGSIEAKVEWRWADNARYYDTVIPGVVKLAGNSKTLVGWVLSDEPSLDLLPRVEQLRLRFRQADPNRFCLTVSMWGETPQVPRKTRLPVVCVDLYPFFGPNDPNGPHTDATSQGFLRSNAQRMVEAIGEKPAVPWVMGMCFSDIWGPRKYDAAGHLIGLPGSYLHWRCPTLAEIRWQVWEILRSRCKGIFIYTLAPETPDPKTESLPRPDVAWKQVLLDRITDSGPNALTNPDCSPTPQLEELGKAYKAIAPHKPLIRRWNPATQPSVEAAPPGMIQCFADPTDRTEYAVLVNDDLHQAQAIELRSKADQTNLIDVIRGSRVNLDKRADGISRGTATLQPGEGTILRISQGREAK
jgi:hypothetical protein